MTTDLKTKSSLTKETSKLEFNLDTAIRGSLSFDQSYRIFSHVMSQVAKLSPYASQDKMEAHCEDYFKRHEQEIRTMTGNLKPLTQLIASCENYDLKLPEDFLEATRTARRLLEKGNAYFYVMTQYYVLGIDELVEKLVTNKNQYNNE